MMMWLNLSAAVTYSGKGWLPPFLRSGRGDALCRDAQFSRGALGDFPRVMDTAGIDLDDLARDDVADGIVAIDEVQGFQGEGEGPVEPFDLLRLDPAFAK